MQSLNVTIPDDVQTALSVAVADIDVPASLMTEADRADVPGQSLATCRPTGITMVLTNGVPWWLITCTGNPVLAEDKLQDAGYPHACAGAPGKIWLRQATDDERECYEQETEEE
jgi:hypothetical protein